jgi:DNA mismatch repair ATPase MutL
VGTSQFIQFIRSHNPLHAGASGFALDDARQAMGRDHASSLPPAADSVADSVAAEVQPQHDARPRKAVMQIHDSYLVTQDEEGIVIIDQHALHERVMFEQLCRRVFGQPEGQETRDADAAAPRALKSQRLLMPEILDVPAAAMEQIEALRPLLQRIGIDAEPIGPTQLAVHAFPTSCSIAACRSGRSCATCWTRRVRAASIWTAPTRRSRPCMTCWT